MTKKQLKALAAETVKAITSLGRNFREERDSLVISFTEKVWKSEGKRPGKNRIAELLECPDVTPAVVRGIFARKGWANPVNKATAAAAAAKAAKAAAAKAAAEGTKEAKEAAAKAKEAAAKAKEAAKPATVAEMGEKVKAEKRAATMAKAIIAMKEKELISILLLLSRPAFDGLETVMTKQGKMQATA